jgi:hypothetical protein
VHFTTQEYFDRIQSKKFPNAQTEIIHSLLTFLAFDNILDLSWYISDDDLPPLLQYSHYHMAHAEGFETTLRDMIIDFSAQAAQWTETKRRKWAWSCYKWSLQPSVFEISDAEVEPTSMEL